MDNAAILELTKSGHLAWAAHCPTHGKTLKNGTFKGTRSSVVRGEQADFDGKRWITFRCSEKGGHLFNALKPKDAPKTVQESQELRIKMLMNKANISNNPDSQKVSA